MKTSVKDLFQAGIIPKSPFPETSRYHGIEMAVKVLPDGTPVAHLKRRPVPDPDRFATTGEVVVRGGDRLDQLAAVHLGDPERFWQLCDANGALQPDELEVPDSRLRVTHPLDVEAADPDEG